MKIIEGIHFQTGKRIKLTMAAGEIAKIEAIPEDVSSNTLPYIASGLIDLQINGHLGRDFNTLPIKDDLVLKVTRSLWREGVTTYFPTIITNSDEAISQAISAIIDACKSDKDVDATIGGIHLEGPFISPEDGPRGAHPRAFVIPPSWSMFQRWQEIAEGRIELITLSPEWPNSVEFIRKCTESGVTVSIGHTGAAPEQIRAAVAAGARMSTHLGNGAHASLPRHPNYIWEQLASDELWACVIGDGFHVPESVLKVILKVKGKRAILVSDVVSLSGMEPGVYKLHIGGEVILTQEGKLLLSENPKLTAGSVKLLTWNIEYLVRSGICQLSEAWELASIHPAVCMNLPYQEGLTVGVPADIVLFDWAEGKIRILETYKNGNEVYRLAL